MPFPHDLPTTSAAALTSYFTSKSHPSLIFAASSKRAFVRDVLKKHKRLGPSERVANIPAVQGALNAYIPYLLAIYQGAPESTIPTSYGGAIQISITETTPFSSSWRSTLGHTIPGREPRRTNVDGVRNELAFVLQSLAYSHVQLARSALLDLSRTTAPSSAVRTNAITSAMKSLIDAHSVQAYVSTLPLESIYPPPVDVSPSVSSALAALALAEATLIIVTKDDPYAAAVADARDVASKEWMIAAPSIPKVRALLFARLCVAAAEHASSAAALFNGSEKVNDALVRFATDLKRTARARAARFLGVDAEASSRTGEGIAWLRGAKRELGVVPEESRKGLKGLKQSWSERREDKKVEKGQDWGMDAGRLEELRIVEWLEAKWVKSNDTINVQAVPPFESLMSTMPSGREYHTPKRFEPPTLDQGMLHSLRAPMDSTQQAFMGEEDDSADEATSSATFLPGAFPTGGNSSYY